MVNDDVAVCDECAAEYRVIPMANGKVRLIDIDHLEEGLWDDVKKVAKTVGSVAKDRWNDSYTKAIATGVKKNFQKSKLGQDLKKIGDSVKETDTYQNLKGKVDSAKQFIKDNKTDKNRKASDMSINVRGKDYKMSDLKYKLGNKKLTPDEVAQMNAFKRNKVQMIVPRGTKPIKEGVEKYMISAKLGDDILYYNASENTFSTDIKDGTQYAEKEIALDDYNTIGKDGFDELEIRSIYDLPLLNKNEAFDVDRVKKRIARTDEFDNGHVLFNYERMTSDEAEEKAKQKSIENPDKVFYVVL